MYETDIPKTQIEREKRGKFLARSYAMSAALSFAMALLAVLLLIGVVVLVFILEFSDVNETLIFGLIGGFAGGTLLSAAAAFLLMKGSERLEKRKDDFLERCDSEESFFIGEGTLATFEERGLRLHAEGKKDIRVPYAEMHFFSVCTRKKPCEKGEWSVVLEIPSRYILKEGKGEPPALVQTDMKPRLMQVLKKHGLDLVGELPSAEAPAKKPFTAEKKYFLPNTQKRRRALMFLIASIALAVVGIPVSFLLDATVGVILSVFGLMLAGKSVHSYVRARAMFAIYPEGLYWRDSDRAESAFLKWSELEHVASEEKDGYPVVACYCAYGAYRFPRPEGMWEYLQEKYPEKLVGEV